MAPSPTRLAPCGAAPQRGHAAASPRGYALGRGQAVPEKRMETEDIGIVAAEAYEVIEEDDTR